MPLYFEPTHLENVAKGHLTLVHQLGAVPAATPKRQGITQGRRMQQVTAGQAGAARTLLTALPQAGTAREEAEFDHVTSQGVLQNICEGGERTRRPARK